MVQTSYIKGKKTQGYTRKKQQQQAIVRTHDDATLPRNVDKKIEAMSSQNRKKGIKNDFSLYLVAERKKNRKELRKCSER